VTRPTGQVYRPRALADMPGDEALSKLRGRSAGPAVRSARLAAGPVSPFPFTSLAMAGHGYTRTGSRHLEKHRGTGINAAGKGNAASAELAAPRAGSLNAVRLSPVDRRPSRSPAGTRPEAPRRLIEKAIEMAARNYPLAENAIFHSDRGSNYTSQQFAVTLKRHGLRQSAGRTGICYDNAMAESCLAALKNECVYRTQYPTREHARRDVVRYIEFWYNSRGRHSGLQYRTPQQVHNEYLEQQSAA
jgi:hypothetical protein